LQTQSQQQDDADQQQLEQQQQQQTAQSQIRFLNANVLQQLQQQDVQQAQQQQQPHVITLQNLQNFVPLQAQQSQHDQQRAQAISVQSLPHQFLQVCKMRNNIISFSAGNIAYMRSLRKFLFHCASTCEIKSYFAGCPNY